MNMALDVHDTDEGGEPSGNSDDHHSTGSEMESDHDEAFSPLMEHFEELATPGKKIPGDTEEHLTLHRQQQQEIQLQQQQQDKFVPGHRASISAKFLSRSQKSSTARYVLFASVCSLS